MTEAQLERILREWMRRLRLGHWDIQIRWYLQPGQNPDGTGEPSDANAEIRVHEDYEQASIRINPDHTGWDVYTANQVIVHELLHVFERGIDQAVLSLAPDTSGALSSTAYELFRHRHSHETEGWVDRLAHILVDLAGPVAD